MNLSRAGVGIAKSVFHEHTVDRLTNPGGKPDSGVMNGWLLCVSVLPPVRRWEWRPAPQPITGD
jgi:hypothetical protein